MCSSDLGLDGEIGVDSGAFDPNTLGGGGSGDGSGGSPDGRKRRGRRAGGGDTAGTGTPAEGKADKPKVVQKGGKVLLNGAVLAPKIQGFHAIAAAITKQPIFVITEQEAKAIGDSVAELMNFYGWSGTVGPGMLWLNLFIVLGAVYYPRYLLIQQQAKESQ